MSNDKELNRKRFQEFTDNTPIGTEVTGTVHSIQPFGVFVDLDNISFHGLVEIVLSKSYPGKQLPYNQEEWPKVDTRIRCVINYFRPHNFEIGLGWLLELDK